MPVFTRVYSSAGSVCVWLKKIFLYIISRMRIRIEAGGVAPRFTNRLLTEALGKVCMQPYVLATVTETSHSTLHALICTSHV